MASPFSVFRRHQKVLMAIACVVGVFAFVLSDSLPSLMGGPSGGGTNPASTRPKDRDVAVHWNGGRLTNGELSQLVFRRRVTNSFQNQVHETGARAEQMVAMTTGVPPRQLTVQPAVGPDQLQEGVERDVVRTRILADLARKNGMSVSDDEIRRYLFELGRGRVSPQEMQKLISNSQSSNRISAEYIFNALREELLARYYYNSLAFAAASVMPEQQWEDWLRVNDRVSVEAAALPTEAYLVDVKEPTEEEITKYYDTYKNVEPGPDALAYRATGVELPSPNPGFRTPRKIEVQYVRAEYEKYLADAKKEITDEQVQKYYDDNKDPYYIKLDTGLLDKEPEKKTEGDADAKQEAGDGKQPAGDAGGKAAEPAAGGNAGATTPVAPTTPAQPATPTTDTKQPAATPAAPDTQKSGKESALNDVPRESVFRFASFEQQPADTNASPPVQPAAPQLGQPATGGATSTAPPAQGDASKSDAAATGTPAAEKQEETPKKPVEFLPLDDQLRDKIREQLARPKVNERLKEITAKLQSDLSDEFGKYYRATIDAREAKQQPPAPPAVLTNLAPLAEANGLEFRKFGPVSQLELREDKPLGQVIDIERTGLPLFYALFGKEPELYKPLMTSDVDNNYYVILKTADTPERVPPLSEIRAEVVKAWRFSKAAEIALKAAEEVAKKLQGSNTSLKDHYANDANVKVVTTDQFAWLTGGEVSAAGGQIRQQPYRMSEPDDLNAVGPEFMKTVFNLDDGQYAAVLNHPHSIAYVVRVAEHQYSQEKLRELYLAEASMWLGQNAMTSARRQSADTAITAAIQESVGYKEDRSLAPREPSSDE